MKKGFLTRAFIIAGFCVAAAVVFLCLGYPNKLVASRYPVKGIDVSSHQGDIDWSKVALSGSIRFAYIKAT